MHDPRLGRFFAIDPIYKKISRTNPYQFSSNNPIGMIETEGLEGVKHSEYDVNDKLIRHVITLKIYVVFVYELDSNIKDELISKLGKEEGKRKWKEIKANRITSDYKSSDVQSVRDALAGYNGDDKKGAFNSVGQRV